jgi:hypothetical protein
MFCDLPVFRFRIEFASCFFTMGFKPIGVGHSQNVRLDLAIVLSPLFWGMSPRWVFPLQRRTSNFSSIFRECVVEHKNPEEFQKMKHLHCIF